MTKREAALVLGAVKLGHIVALACGDIFNRGENALICISADGHCKVFDFAVGDLIIDATTPISEKSGGSSGKDPANTQCANQESNKVERYSKTNCTG